MQTVPQPVSEAKRLIGTYTLIDVEVLRDLNDAIANNQITLTEIRVILAAWYIHTLYAKVSPEIAKGYIKRHLTHKEVNDVFQRYQSIIDPDQRKSPVQNNRKIPKKLLLTLANECSLVEIGICLLCCTQGSVRHRFTFMLGQRRCAGRFKVSTQAISQAIHSLLVKQVLNRSLKKMPPSWGYHYRFHPSQLRRCSAR